MKRKIALLLAVCLIATLAFTACTPSPTTDTTTYTDDGGEVTLKWILAGPGKQSDSEEVWAEFNRQLAELLPNTKVEFEVIASGDYLEKWNLLKASNEAIDIAWAGYFTPFKEDIASGAFLPISDILDNDCQELRDALPDWVWAKTSLNGVVYGVPCYQMMNDGPSSLQFYKEDADKYLDRDAWVQAYAENETMTAELWQMWDDHFAVLEENGVLRSGYGTEGFLPAKGYEMLGGHAGVLKSDNDLKVVDVRTSEGYTTFNDAVRRWYEKGYVVEGIQNMTQQERDRITKDAENGFSITVHQYYGEMGAARQSASIGYEVDQLPTEKNFYIGSGSASTMNCVTRTSKNPVRAVKLLELLTLEKGKDLFNLLAYGFEGKHYNKLSDDGVIELIEGQGGVTSDSAYGLDGWTIGNTFNGYMKTPDTPAWFDFLLNDVHGTALVTPLSGFSLDTSAIKVELNNIGAVDSEYAETFRWGAYPDYKERWQEFVNKSEQAGVSKVIAEVQRQIDEWKASK